eukprot:TRINITY_DN10345_c0_g1_i4.p2 TRINITY_DN10345_c0_g1~~TRINITY_DN10345_c0_g1_i4.p2  ORF type:complete len:167 (+),score=9.94 TRINITY_DN10345_c0_g1_i4:648-1148(+)
MMSNKWLIQSAWLPWTAAFVGFLIQTDDAEVTLATTDTNAKTGPCTHQSLTHTSPAAKTSITFTSTRPNTTNVEYRVTVLGAMGGSYWIFDTTPTDAAMTSAMPTTTAGADDPLSFSTAFVLLMAGALGTLIFQIKFVNPYWRAVIPNCAITGQSRCMLCILEKRI